MEKKKKYNTEKQHEFHLLQRQMYSKINKKILTEVTCQLQSDRQKAVFNREDP